MNLLFLLDVPPVRMTAPSSRFIELGRFFKSRGHAVRIVGSWSDAAEQEPDIEVVRLPHLAGGGLHQALFPFRRALRPHLEWCDVLIVRGYWIALWSMLRAGRRPLRIYDFHGLTYKEQVAMRRWRGAALSWAAESMVTRISDRILAVTEGFEGMLSPRCRGKAVLLENGVAWPPLSDPEPVPSREILCRAWGIPEDRPIVTAIAQFGPQLDVRTMVAAAEQWGDVATLVIIGDGPALDEVQQEVSLSKLSRVFMVGRKPHEEAMRFLHHAADASICPYSDQWPQSRIPNYYGIRKVKEYLAAGKPILVASVPACESFLVHESNCLHYRPGDPHDLANQVQRLLAEPDLRDRLSAASIETAAHYSWASVIERGGLIDWLEKERTE